MSQYRPSRRRQAPFSRMRKRAFAGGVVVGGAGCSSAARAGADSGRAPPPGAPAGWESGLSGRTGGIGGSSVSGDKKTVPDKEKDGNSGCFFPPARVAVEKSCWSGWECASGRRGGVLRPIGTAASHSGSAPPESCPAVGIHAALGRARKKMNAANLRFARKRDRGKV